MTIIRVDLRSPDGVGPLPDWTPVDIRLPDAIGPTTPPSAPVPDPEQKPPERPEKPLNFSLDTVTVVGSSARILKFPATATWQHLGIRRDGILTILTPQRPWPAVAIDDSGNPAQTATLWVLLCIEGQWYATGAERLRPNQIAGDAKPEGSPATLIGEGWLYDPGRWGRMANYNPTRGEIVGMMVVAGSTRSDDNTPVEERTPILFFPWPGDGAADPVDVRWTVS